MTPEFMRAISTRLSPIDSKSGLHPLKNSANIKTIRTFRNEDLVIFETVTQNFCCRLDALSGGITILCNDLKVLKLREKGELALDVIEFLFLNM
jgi:hypothetical protein